MVYNITKVNDSFHIYINSCNKYFDLISQNKCSKLIPTTSQHSENLVSYNTRFFLIVKLCIFVRGKCSAKLYKYDTFSYFEIWRTSGICILHAHRSSESHTIILKAVSNYYMYDMYRLHHEVEVSM